MSATTFTTSTECFKNALGTDVEPDADSMPTLLAIDGYRVTVFNLICNLAGISSASEDVNGICKMVELELVSAKIMSVVNNTTFFFMIPDDYKILIQSVFPLNMPVYVWIPNENG